MVKKRTMKAAMNFKLLMLILAVGSFMVKGEPMPARGNIAMQQTETDTIGYTNLLIRPFYLEIVPPSSGVQFYRDGIIFLSHTKAEEKIPERHISFGSVRTYATVISDTIPGSYVMFDLEGPALFPTEATTFSYDYNTMYLSLIPEGTTREKIFRANYHQTGWKIESYPLEICSGNYIYSHPCLSANGTFMIFSSDMPGTTGGLDLFITRKTENSWSKPENLGQYINSSGNELFASLDKRNNLYFSSDGLAGKGGYDIFICRYNGEEWERPQNLPGTINTKDDDLAFTINKDSDKTAFYTLRSRSGKHRTQLFIVNIKQGLASGENLTMGEVFLANTGADMVDPGTEKSGEKMNGIASTITREKPAENPGKNMENVQPATVTQIAMANRESERTTNQTGTETPTEVKKEVIQAERQVQSASTEIPGKDHVVYRVQILANTKPLGSRDITVAGKVYKSFEYLYQGGYRTTIGEFSTLSEAARLQSICRQNGFGQAFVVAFKNNARSTDPALFK
ncbi:MAG: hypothetical protein ACM3NP_07125 [Actinomycetota bacterium]|jgi:hypothetical protein